jgi:hypothetical protein
MAKKTKRVKSSGFRSDRAKLTPEETLKRMEEFPKRREKFIAAIRKNKNRGISA